MKQPRPQSAQKLLGKNETRRTPVHSVVHPLPPDRRCLKCGHRLFLDKPKSNLEPGIWECADSLCKELYREERKTPSAQPHPADEAEERNRIQYSLYCATFITREERRILEHHAETPTLHTAQAALLEIQHRDDEHLDALLKRKWKHPEQAWLHAIIEAESAMFKVAACSLAFRGAGVDVWLAPFDQLSKMRRAHTAWQASEREITRRDLRQIIANRARARRPLFQPVPPEPRLSPVPTADELDALYEWSRQRVLSADKLEIIYEHLSKVKLSRQSTQQYHPFLLDTYTRLRARGLSRHRAAHLLAGLAFVHVPGYQAMQPAKRRRESPTSTTLDALVHRLNAMIDRAHHTSTRATLR